jgi:tetratricopeptide (TPR) repeat protein
MTTETLITLPVNLKTFRASIALDHLQEMFPQIETLRFQQEQLTAFIKRHFKGSAQVFKVDLHDEKVLIEWGISKPSEEVETLNHNALNLAKNRQFEQAAELWRKALILHKDDPDYHYNLGLALFELKNYLKGLDRCKEALAICPVYYRAGFVLGSIYSKQRQFDAAELYLQQGLLFQPSNVMALVNLGAVNSIQKKYDSAIRAFEKAIALSSKETKAYLGLGKLYSLQKDFENANRCFKIVVKLDPDGRLGLIAQNSILNIPAAGNINNQSSTSQIDIDQLYTKAHHSFLTGDYALSEKYYKEYLKSKPRDANAWSALATSQLRLGHREHAVHAIESAIKISPSKAAFHKQAGIIYDAFGMAAESGNAAQRAVELGKQDSVTMALLGIAHYRNDHLQESIRILQDAVSRNSNNLKARYYLAKALKDSGQRDLAKQHYEEILWSQSSSPLKEKARAEISELIQNGRFM